MISIAFHCDQAHITYGQGCTKGVLGGTMPRAPNHWGRKKVPTMSLVLSSIYYIYSQKPLGSNIRAPKLFLAPWRHLASVRPCIWPFLSCPTQRPKLTHNIHHSDGKLPDSPFQLHIFLNELHGEISIIFDLLSGPVVDALLLWNSDNDCHQRWRYLTRVLCWRVLARNNLLITIRVDWKSYRKTVNPLKTLQSTDCLCKKQVDSSFYTSFREHLLQAFIFMGLNYFAKSSLHCKPNNYSLGQWSSTFFSHGHLITFKILIFNVVIYKSYALKSKLRFC